MSDHSSGCRMTTGQVVDVFHLELRCMILEAAAMLDRYDRAAVGEGRTGMHDDRWERCLHALAQLTQPNRDADRAEQTALIFSDSPPETSA